MEACHLTATDLACRRGERLLFRGLSFALTSGDALHIAGPNGTGKSSLMRLLAGLATPFSGTTSRQGAIGLVDEHPALDEHLPLGEALHFWAQLDGTTIEVPDALGLATLQEVPVRFLSTGQRKRAALARLISQDAPIWLLDEPLNGLDKAAVSLCEDLISAHCAKGGIAVIASHQSFAIPNMRSLMLTDFTV